MIATTDYSGTYIGSSTYLTRGYFIPDDYVDFTETVTEASLRMLREQIFIPRKIGLKNNFKVQKKLINIRNQLPYKLRFD